MKGYYKERLANIREVFRGFILLLMALISGIASMVFYILIKGFNLKIFALITFMFINFLILVFVLVKLYLLMDEIVNKIKG